MNFLKCYAIWLIRSLETSGKISPTGYKIAAISKWQNAKKSRMTRDSSKPNSFFPPYRQNLARLNILLYASTLYSVNYEGGAAFTLFLSGNIQTELLTPLEFTPFLLGIFFLTSFHHNKLKGIKINYVWEEC